MTRGTVRHAYLDWVRGVAVLIMIEAHVLDAWTHAGDRARPLYGYAMILGGFGAPMFLFLAGVVAVLSAESKVRKSGDFAASWRAAEMRGWQLFAFAFLFRLQSYILSGANNAIDLLKVDILNIMGPAIAFAAIAGRTVRRSASRGVLFAITAAAVSLLTPLVRTAPILAWLPDPLEWYFRPSPGRTNFTLFPWSGFVFAGAAIGVLLDATRSLNRPGRLQLALAGVGGMLVWLAYEASFRPSILWPSDFWTTSASFFFLRLGLLILLLPISYTWQLRRPPGSGQLVEYEARISGRLASAPMTVICAYDTRRFPGDLLADVVAVHPMTLTAERMIMNKSPLTPEEYRQSVRSRRG